MKLTMSEVNVYLKDHDSDEGLFPRTLLLNAHNNWSARVGRATSTGSGPDEEKDNACFKSRVISREHAYIEANPETGAIYVKDVGSMHGTHIHGQRLKDGKPWPLHDNDVVSFGAAVDRGDSETSDNPSLTRGLQSTETFFPVDVKVSWQWHTAEYASPRLASASSNSHRSLEVMHLSNTFVVPELSDEDEDEDGEIYDPDDENEFRNEPVHITIADSDDSNDAMSLALSDSIVSDVESPSSSPLASADLEGSTSKSAEATSTVVVEGGSSQDNKPQRDAVVQQKPSVQSKLSIAQLLEDEADRLASNETRPESSSNLDSDNHWDEYHVEEVDEFDEFDEFEDKGPRPAPSSSPIRFPTNPQPPRDPSPSDAAMVKPITDPTRAPPFGDLFSFKVPPAVNPGLSHRSENSWAGHNAVLYDPPAPLSEPIFDMEKFPVRPAHLQSGTPRYPGWPGPPNSYYESPSHSISPFLLHQPITQTARKRKADDISEGSDVPAARQADPVSSSGDSDANSADVIHDKGPCIEMPNAEIPIIAVSSVAEMIKSPAPAAAESPRKRQKTSKGKSGSRPAQKASFTKYAATALAGAAVGTLGTIFGLMYLPEDFF